MNQITLKNYVNLSLEEHKSLLTIRNIKSIREVSLNTQEISFENHLSWIKALKDNEDKLYYAIFYEDKIIGAINVFDINTKIKWGVFFEQEASLMIKSLVPLYFIEYIFKHFYPEKLFLDVKKQNKNAIAFNTNLGFKICHEENDIITMSIDYKAFNEAKDNRVLKRIVKKLNMYEFIMES